MITSRVQWAGVVALAVAGALGSVHAWGASFTGRASTVLEWYDSADEKQATPILQYLALRGKDLGTQGLNFWGYGRLSTDLQDEVDVPSELYFAFLEKKNLVGNLNVRLGRVNLATPAGFSVVDGLVLDLNRVGPLTLRAYGGGDVKFDDDYDAGNLTWGGEVAGEFLDGALNVSGGYLQAWDGAELTRELFGAELNYDRSEIFEAYSEVQFDYLRNVVSYFLGGAKYYRNPKWNLRAHYLYSLPVFDSTSIYSVFSVEEYEELMGEFVYSIQPSLRVFARYTRELYDDFADANVLDVGVEQVRTHRFFGYLIGTYRDDEAGQDLMGVKVHAAYRFTDRVQLGAGAHLDVLERRIEEDDETTSRRLWADAVLFLTPKQSLEVKLEEASSDLYDDYYRGRVRWNYRF